jgi:hypothetical protein
MIIDETTLDYIRERILFYTNIDVKDNSRKRDVVYARAIFTKLLRDAHLMPYQKIGDYLGKNHCTMMHSYKLFDTVQNYERRFYKVYRLLCMEIEQEDAIRLKFPELQEKEDEKTEQIRGYIKEAMNELKPEYEAYIN